MKTDPIKNTPLAQNLFVCKVDKVIFAKTRSFRSCFFNIDRKFVKTHIPALNTYRKVPITRRPRKFKCKCPMDHLKGASVPLKICYYINDLGK